MIHINVVLIIVLFIMVLILLFYNWSITRSVYDLEDELDEAYSKFDTIEECLKEIALACDKNTNFIVSLCDEATKQEEQVDVV